MTDFVNDVIFPHTISFRIIKRKGIGECYVDGNYLLTLLKRGKSFKVTELIKKDVFFSTHRKILRNINEKSGLRY